MEHKHKRRNRKPYRFLISVLHDVGLEAHEFRGVPYPLSTYKHLPLMANLLFIFAIVRELLYFQK